MQPLRKQRQQTPEAFCWLYEVGCLDSRHHEGTLSNEEYFMALDFLFKGEVPPSEVIRKWFPKPFLKLEGELHRPCILEEMQDFWRNKHSSKGENTPVYLAEVLSVTEIADSHTFVRASVKKNVTHAHDLNAILAQDVHHLNPQEGELVYIHGAVVAELVK